MRHTHLDRSLVIWFCRNLVGASTPHTWHHRYHRWQKKIRVNLLINLLSVVVTLDQFTVPLVNFLKHRPKYVNSTPHHVLTQERNALKLGSSRYTCFRTRLRHLCVSVIFTSEITFEICVARRVFINTTPYKLKIAVWFGTFDWFKC